MYERSALMFGPITSDDLALLIAPHLVCPNTIICLAPATLVAYSRLPIISGVAMFPAILETHNPPALSSKISVMGSLASIQLNIAA